MLEEKGIMMTKQSIIKNKDARSNDGDGQQKYIKGKAKWEYELLEALSLCWSTTTFIIRSQWKIHSASNMRRKYSCLELVERDIS